MKKTNKNYLRKLRLKSGLTRSDVCFLLGVSTKQIITDIEKHRKLPSLDILLGCRAVFSESVVNIVPSEIAKTENQISDRAKKLFEKLSNQKNVRNHYQRLETLKRIVDENN